MVPDPDDLHQQHFINAVIHPVTGKQQEYSELIRGPDEHTWTQANINEIGRLTDGRIGKNIVPTNTLQFIYLHEMPKGRKATYLRVVADYQPHKEDPNRIRWTVGGNQVDYPWDKSTPTADMTTAKILFNSVISTKDARFGTADIKDFYLNTPMERIEYMWVPVKYLPPAVMDAYNLHDKVVNGRVLVAISKGMYGLPQAGKLAYDQLVKHLAPFGYHPCKRTPGLWTHETRPLSFCLVVDDFGVKYVGKQHMAHLIAAIQTGYKATVDWEGKLYCGLTLDWDYQKGTVDVSMPGYVEEALHKFQHPTPHRPKHAPHDWMEPTYD